MGWIEAIVLGVVQGLTEFLPISSTAHLRIVPAFFGWEDPGAAFTAVTQLGTMAAVLLFFRKDLWAIAVAWVRGLTDAEQRRTRESLLGWYILIGTIPIGVFVLLFADQIETGARMTVETVEAEGLAEGIYADGLGQIASAHGGVSIGSYPSFSTSGFRNQIVVRGKDPAAVAGAVAAVRDLLGRLRGDRAPL